MGRIAITGAASFLGSRLLRRLVERRGPGFVVDRHPDVWSAAREALR